MKLASWQVLAITTATSRIRVVPNYGYKPMAGIIYKYFLSPHVGLRVGASFTQLTAADSLSDIFVKKQRNLSFATNLFEVHGGIEINLLPIDVDRMKVTPYIFGGIAVFYYNPYTSAPNGDKIFLRPLSTEGEGLPNYPDRKQYSLVNVAFPFGGGLKFLVGKTLVITTEVGIRYTATDYLDDVSKSYVNLDTLAMYRGGKAAQLSYRGNELPNWDVNGNNKYPDYKFQRGDDKMNDWYYFAGINIAVYFPRIRQRRPLPADALPELQPNTRANVLPLILQRNFFRKIRTNEIRIFYLLPVTKCIQRFSAFTSPCRAQPATWSFTMPAACMKA